MQPERALPRILPALLITALAAQDDMRDVVRLLNGKEVQGRVLARHEPGEVTVLQGGKRVRVDKDRIASMTTVRDQLREFFGRRDKLQDNARFRWILAEWAANSGLPAMARLQALDIVLREPDHAAARALLGHQKRGEQWLWPRQERWFTLPELQAFGSEWGHALVLEGEHFALRTTGTVRQAVDTLLDLERLYVWWMDTFGIQLELREVVTPKLPVHVWGDPKSFPAWSSFVVPYFRPRVANGLEASESLSYTWLEKNAGRPVRLFEVGIQHLMYRTLADDPDLLSPKNRLCAWAEVGFGQYVERMFRGQPGRVQPVAWQIAPAEARLVLDQRSYGLEHLTHRQIKQYYITVADNTQLDWASAHLFVAYLMEQPSLRNGFLLYLFEAIRKGKGASSSAFDAALETRVESLEKPWRLWIEQRFAELRPGGQAKTG